MALTCTLHLKSFYFSARESIRSQQNKTRLLCLFPILLNCLSFHTFLVKKLIFFAHILVIRECFCVDFLRSTVLS